MDAALTPFHCQRSSSSFVLAQQMIEDLLTLMAPLLTQPLPAQEAAALRATDNLTEMCAHGQSIEFPEAKWQPWQPLLRRPAARIAD